MGRHDDMIQSHTRLYYQQKMEYEKIALALAEGKAVTSQWTLPLLQKKQWDVHDNVYH